MTSAQPTRRSELAIAAAGTLFLCLGICVLNLSVVPAQDPVAKDADAELLEESRLPADASGLLALMRKWPGDDRDLVRLDEFVRNLASESFAERAAASAALTRLGPPAVLQLLAAIRGPDAESSRRAEACLAEINKSWRPELQLAAVRRLARLRPPGTVEALLRFLPWTSDDDAIEEMFFSLYDLAKVSPGTKPAFRRALCDRLPLRRAVAGCVLGRLGDDAERNDARRLLTDASPEVRLRTAQGLLAASDTAAVPALIELLLQPDVRISWSAEELLHWSARGNAPPQTVGAADVRDRQASRDAWHRWWRRRAMQLDWNALHAGYWRPGLMFICSSKGFTEVRAKAKGPLLPLTDGELSLYGCDGHRWHLRTHRVQSVQLLRGNRLFASQESPRFTTRDSLDAHFQSMEVNLHGAVRWAATTPSIWAGAFPRRLPSGHTFVPEPHEDGESRNVAVLADPHGNPAHPLSVHENEEPQVAFRHCISYLWNGRLLCVGTRQKREFVLEYGCTTGKLKRAFAVPAVTRVRPILPSGYLLFLPGGLMLHTDPYGQVVHEVRAPYGVLEAAALRNGNYLALRPSRVRVLTPSGRTLWEQPLTDPGYHLAQCLKLIQLGFDFAISPGLDLFTDLSHHRRRLKSADARAVSLAVQDLRELGPRAAPVAKDCIEAFADKDFPVNKAAVRDLLKKMGPDIQPLLFAATKDNRAAVRANVILTLPGCMSDPRSASTILTATKDPAPMVRQVALERLPEMWAAEKSVLHILRNAIQDRVPTAPGDATTVAETAVRVLGYLGPDAAPAIPDILEAAKAPTKDGGWHLRTQCFWSLGYIGFNDQRILAYLLESFHSKDVPGGDVGMEFRSAILWSLGGAQSPTTQAVALLASTAVDRTAHIGLRRTAIAALGRLGPAAKDALPALTTLGSERIEELRTAAQDALARIRGSQD